jgi:competence protein ComEC
MPLIAIVAIIAMLCLHFRTKTWISGAIIGFLWASSVGHWYSSLQLPNRYFNENIIVEGTVYTMQIQLTKDSQAKASKESVVYVKNNQKSVTPKTFIFKLDKIAQTSLLHSPSLRLSWFNPTMQIQQGDKLRLLVKIKPPHALGNEGGFNGQKWLASQNIVGIGSVRDSPSNLHLRHGASVRQKLANQLLEYADVLNLQNTRWILALSLGERALFERNDWKLLQSTGTAHLFAISGLHLGIVSLLFFSLTKMLLFAAQQIVNSNQQSNITRLALVVSVPFCIFYAYLSGFQIPVIRSVIALTLLAYLVYYQLYWRPITSLTLLLVFFFILFPLSILGMSFWFSFGAILAICFFIWRYPKKVNSSWGKVKQAIALQVFLSLLMLPLIGMSFGVVSSVSVIVNLIVMPVVSLLWVPVCLLLVFSLLMNTQALTLTLLKVIDWAFEQLTIFMHMFSNFSLTTFDLSGQKNAIWFLIFGIIILVFLPFWPHRKKVIFALSLAVYSLSSANKNSHSNWSVRVFDIGQGLSVLVRQGDRFLLYDTGQSFFMGGSLAQTVIAPYFENVREHSHVPFNQAPSLDFLINSHMDNDHSGGNSFIFEHFNVKQWLTPAAGCTANSSFVWGKLSVKILWPLREVSGDDNNDSCVLMISDGNMRVLLSGDIEKKAELAILQNYEQSALKANILIAPHHGSKTSSSRPFIRAVEPQYVIVSSKYLNHWGFPDSSVLANYDEAKAQVFNTAFDGEIVFEFTERDLDISAYRDKWWAPWYMRIRKINSLMNSKAL